MRSISYKTKYFAISADTAYDEWFQNFLQEESKSFFTSGNQAFE